MSVKLWERLEVAEKLIADLQRRVAQLEKATGLQSNGKPRDPPVLPLTKRAG